MRPTTAVAIECLQDLAALADDGTWHLPEPVAQSLGRYYATVHALRNNGIIVRTVQSLAVLHPIDPAEEDEQNIIQWALQFPGDDRVYGVEGEVGQEQLENLLMENQGAERWVPDRSPRQWRRFDIAPREVCALRLPIDVQQPMMDHAIEQGSAYVRARLQQVKLNARTQPAASTRTRTRI